MSEIILVGAGGHCKSVIDVIETAGEYTIKGVIDLPKNVGGKVLNYDIIGSDEDLPRLISGKVKFHITVGHIQSNLIRIQLYQNIKKLGGQVAVIKSKHALISKYSTIGDGSFIGHNTVVNAGASIGQNCIINTGAIIEHDSQVGHNCHISTCCTINADCIIHDNCFLSSHVVVNRGITIERNIIIGSGSVVTKSLTHQGSTYFGIPSTLKK